MHLLVTTNVPVACACVLVRVVLSLKQLLSFRYGSIELDPLAVDTVANSVASDTRRREPGVDGIDSGLGRSEEVDDFLCGHVLAVAGVVHVRHGHQTVMAMLQISLDETDTHGEDSR